ncbi:MAG: mandelate racemase/muconate lactonizing enzyme family protein, partial [Chloroflexota bacterium]|nr:mandelate racemase/muconate lactonizing enzyme family protein [Chloroflexota bacterium]
MKITSVETFVVDAGWRPWLFVKVATDEGVVGYGECSDCWSPQPHGIVGTVKDLTPLLLGQDPRPYERRVWDLMY